MKEKNKLSLTKGGKWLYFGVWLSLIAMVLIIVGSCSLFDYYSNKLYKKIEEKVLPYCKGDSFIFYDIEGSMIKFDYYNEISHTGSGNKVLEGCKYYTCDLITSTEDNYYFLLEINHGFGESTDTICRTNKELKEIEIVYDFGRDIKHWNSGFDNKLYFVLDSKYYTFNIESLELLESEKESNDEKLAKMSDKDFASHFGYSLVECKQNNGLILFDNKGRSISFDENKIDSDFLSLMRNFKFKPKYCVSCQTSKTAVLYFNNNTLQSLQYCLMVIYDFEKESINEYQLFNCCTTSNFQLYPKY